MCRAACIARGAARGLAALDGSAIQAVQLTWLAGCQGTGRTRGHCNTHGTARRTRGAGWGLAAHDGTAPYAAQLAWLAALSTCFAVDGTFNTFAAQLAWPHAMALNTCRAAALPRETGRNRGHCNTRGRTAYVARGVSGALAALNGIASFATQLAGLAALPVC